MVLALQDGVRILKGVNKLLPLGTIGPLGLSGLGMKARLQRLSFPDSGKDT